MRAQLPVIHTSVFGDDEDMGGMTATGDSGQLHFTPNEPVAEEEPAEPTIPEPPELSQAPPEKPADSETENLNSAPILEPIPPPKPPRLSAVGALTHFFLRFYLLILSFFFVTSTYVFFYFFTLTASDWIMGGDLVIEREVGGCFINSVICPPAVPVVG
ncbi:hypothetical protein L873DRAFT_1789571 [Choiromyces venosus 120613-1]|uniref:Uncharacterized protein n=1 Tax=Choiromyces venosus 120613-1 TaxID=1336337 RepID=A0A3N4JU03_9PEZI|nr:hypothetical protein L873DRAFT_1789571 [Choiromyces venosus 120613-1]